MKSRKNEAKSRAHPQQAPPMALAGTTVLVTRPLNQSSDLTRRLQERGAVVINFATIEIAPPETWEGLDRAIAGIDSYDWLVFTSANGARFFFERAAKMRVRTQRRPASQLLCAIGPATARAVESAGASVELVVADSRAEGVFRAIVDRAGGETAVRGLRFLLPCARHARDFLPVELRKLDAHVDVVEAYQTLKPNEDLGSLFALHKIDAITFTSPSTVSNFVKLIDAERLPALASETLAACIGPVTAAAAMDHGFKQIVQAESATVQALAEAIARSINEP